MIYNKLVRDKIPELIASQGKHIKFKTLQGEELKQAIKDKLVEEVNEIINAQTEEEIIEEIADTLTVLGAFMTATEIDSKVIKMQMINKAVKKGSFTKGYFLESVED